MSTKPFDYITTSNHTANNPQSYPQSRYPELRELNARLQNISEKVIPVSPYILTVASSCSFDLSPFQADDLLRGTPFKAKEEHLQYLSFLADWDNGLITPVGGWDNDKGEIMEHVSDTRSTATTPKVGAKKIPWSDYTSRTAGQSNANGHIKVNGSTRSEGASSVLPFKATQQIQTGQKRSSDILENSNPIPEKNKGEELAPPSKKARTSPIPSSSSQATQTAQTKATPRLELPPPISPTLPPAIEKELARLSELSSALSQSSSSTKMKLIPSGNSSKRKLSPGPRDIKSSVPKTILGDIVSSQVPISGRDSKRTGSSKHLPDHQTQPLKSWAKNDRTKVATNSHGTASDTTDHPLELSTSRGAKQSEKLQTKIEPKLSKIVKLKIPRAKRKDLARLLQMKPRPKADTIRLLKQAEKEPIVKSIEGPLSRPEKERTRPQPGKPVVVSETSETRKEDGRVSSGIQDVTKAREKRPRPEENTVTLVPSSKRQKNLPNMDLNSKPSTPVPAAFKSPVLSHGSAQKLRGSPNPDARAVGSRNEEAATTPQGSVRNGTPVAPNSVDRSNRDARSSSITNSVSGAASMPNDAALLRREQKKYFELGRILKRESDALLNSSESGGSPRLEKKGLAISVETILCFMLAYSIGDELLGASSHSPTSSWNTIFPFINKVKFSTRGFRHLHGLCLQLEATCRMASWTLEYEGASSSEYQHSLEKHKALKKQYDEARLLFVKGSQELSVEDLQQSFPNTWRSNSRAPWAYTPQKTSSSPLAGGFFLPITSATVPLEAVRAGRSVITEWCKSESVDFKLRVGP